MHWKQWCWLSTAASQHGPGFNPVLIVASLLVLKVKIKFTLCVSREICLGHKCCHIKIHTILLFSWYSQHRACVSMHMSCSTSTDCFEIARMNQSRRSAKSVGSGAFGDHECLYRVLEKFIRLGKSGGRTNSVNKVLKDVALLHLLRLNQEN